MQQTALKYWLFFGIGALALAGLFAILLVTARSPVVQELIPLTDIFHKALTVHVNLSVLVWFLALTVVFWRMATPGVYTIIDKFSFYGAVGGVVLFVLAPFLQEGEALLNNYVPILDNTPFKVGIALFLAAVLAEAGMTLARCCAHQEEGLPFRRAVQFSALIYITACIAFLWSYIDLADPEIDFNAAQFYESFFWGGGHILQFLYAQVMMLAWWTLAGFSGGGRLVQVTFAMNLLFALAGLASYFVYPAYEPEHIALFTRLMKYGNGIAPLLFAVFLLPRVHRGKGRMKWLLLCSMVMFGAGGGLGYAIEGVNTVIPAHYHGSIVGVTLALMGIAYTLLPQLGFAPVRKKFLTLQSFIYSIGQLMHIVGLAWSGGYGALRKTPGAMASFEGQAAMGLMGLGGLLSVIGGFMFVLLCVGSVWNKGKTRVGG